MRETCGGIKILSGVVEAVERQWNGLRQSAGRGATEESTALLSLKILRMGHFNAGELGTDEWKCTPVTGNATSQIEVIPVQVDVNRFGD